MSDIIQCNMCFPNLVLCMQRRTDIINPKWCIPCNELLWLQIIIQIFHCKFLFLLWLIWTTMLFLFLFKHLLLINMIIFSFFLLFLSILKYLLAKIMLTLSMLSQYLRICRYLLLVMFWYIGGMVSSYLVAWFKIIRRLTQLHNSFLGDISVCML